MEYIDNCLYNGVELPKLPENLPYAGRIIVHLESFGYLLVSTNTIPEVSGTAVEWGDNNLSVGYEIVGGEWVAGASGTGSLGSIAGGYFLWTNNTIYNSDGSVHLAATAIVRISTDTEEINAGVYKYWHFTFMDGDDNTLADPKATYDLLITNDVTGDILTEADWINMASFPKVYIYNTSPEHHTVRIMMTWEGTDGLKYRGYKYIVIGEAMAVMMVSGNVANMPSLFESVRFLTTAVSSGMGYADGLYRDALFSIALVLFLFIMMINAVLNFFLKGEKHE